MNKTTFIEKRECRGLTAEEIKRAIETIDGLCKYPALASALHGGIRVLESKSIGKKDVIIYAGEEICNELREIFPKGEKDKK